ncbi:O-methyltransferase [Aurantivibrio plasticivorans]
MGNSVPLDFNKVYPYVCDNSLRETPLLQLLRKQTAELPNASMQIPPEQGQLLGLLTRLTGAHHAIEIGTFTGYSSLCIAEALPNDGKLICCDISEEYTTIAKKYWRQADVEHKIELKLGPAIETLSTLLKHQQKETFDLVFIDADKTSYIDYYELSLELLKPNGLIIFDNMLWGGKVTDENERDEDTVALREMNRLLHGDQRVDISLLTVADGITLTRKR